MDKVAGVVGLVLVLILVSRGLPSRRWPVVIAATLAVVLAVVMIERAGLWPASWTVR